MQRKVLIGLAFVIVIGLGVFCFIVPVQVDKAYNGLLHPPPYPASAAARTLHAALRLADLHATRCCGLAIC